MTEERLLRRDEIPLVWEIDRSEVIEHLYSVEAGQLVLRPEFYDMRGWPEGEAEHYTPILLDCFDRGGWFLGLFDQSRLIGAVVLDPRRLGPERDWLQLKFLHLSHAYRRRGLGAHLFHLAATRARHPAPARSTFRLRRRRTRWIFIRDSDAGCAWSRMRSCIGWSRRMFTLFIKYSAHNPENSLHHEDPIKYFTNPNIPVHLQPRNGGRLLVRQRHRRQKNKKPQRTM